MGTILTRFPQVGTATTSSGETDWKGSGLQPSGPTFYVAHVTSFRIFSNLIDMGDSVQGAPLMVRKQSGLFSELPSWQGVALVILLVLLYANILVRLFNQWGNDPNASHGFFVPVFALFVLWKNRNELKSIPAAPNWNGLWLVAGALAMLVLGDYGAELFFERASLLVLLAGLIILLQGWPLFRAVFFPWAF